MADEVMEGEDISEGLVEIWSQGVEGAETGKCEGVRLILLRQI